MRRSNWQGLQRASELWGRGLAEVLDGAAGGGSRARTSWSAALVLRERPARRVSIAVAVLAVLGALLGGALIRRGWARSRTRSAWRGGRPRRSRSVRSHCIGLTYENGLCAALPQLRGRFRVFGESLNPQWCGSTQWRIGSDGSRCEVSCLRRGGPQVGSRLPGARRA